jgi:hypothetical protein
MKGVEEDEQKDIEDGGLAPFYISSTDKFFRFGRGQMDP